MDQQKLDKAIGRRLKTLRMNAGMTLNELAARSGVSRAMIGRVEGAQSSATAALLNRLCAALDVSLSDVVALAEKPPERLVRLADQPQWRDPESGYVRRHASPTGAVSGIEVIVVDLPAGARVSYSPWGRNAFTQQLLMLEGAICVHIDAKTQRLREGDCLDFDVMRSVIFENDSKQPARYVIVVRRGTAYGRE
ncbi:helix-turn-helix domain-containing protein [Bradyrhizobium liaoningense]|uniref:helix-turn-helix domain-containing protein n=1 Tax=Bradyrhizobium liaoningense TaxID=43992 RepID=UPI001BA7FA1E|nr:XRE family transcriptional regulator [Bradyrhizobium liaoningense]MBR0718375.1 helix-turn-helix transcriptional regulator [Bradyrhizobium liaoningense]